MPKREDIKSILLIGSGPIVIGQACEFDYSGTQACKALKDDGYRVILANSNPATIMTDATLADATYLEPLHLESVAEIIKKERPEALLPTLGGQTALNLARDLAAQGVLETYGVELIGATIDCINKAEDRELFKKQMIGVGLAVPQSSPAHSMGEAWNIVEEMGFPVIIRPSFTLGGSGGNIAYNRDEFERHALWGLVSSPVSEILIEEVLAGWKEFELEVMQDGADNFVVVCSIENLDPMGIHTGDSITVAPAQTLSDDAYQNMRDSARKVMQAIGVRTGGANIQFAICPQTGKQMIIEMNPRVSRSSALASKATGFPIAKIAAKLAVGYLLPEIRNDITRHTPASFEPSIDYVVTKIPRFAFEKFPSAKDTLGSQMKSVGEVMAIGRTFAESLQKAIRSLEIKEEGLEWLGPPLSVPELRNKIKTANSRRLWALAEEIRRGTSLEELNTVTGIDPWFLHQIKAIVDFEAVIRDCSERDVPPELLLQTKRLGFSDKSIAMLMPSPLANANFITKHRRALGIRPIYNRVDTCAAEFEAHTPYLYSSYESVTLAFADESRVSSRKKVAIIGSGPNRIGQGIEFDYCCVHACMALREMGYETIMINCNPETVSTDYDTADRLYFEPLTEEDVIEILKRELPDGVITQLGGQTPLQLARAIETEGFNIWGTKPASIDVAEDRKKFQEILSRLELRQPKNAIAESIEQAISIAERMGFPLIIRPSYVLGGRAMEIVYDAESFKKSIEVAFDASSVPVVLLEQFLKDAIEVDVDALCDGKDVFIAAVMEHIEEAGVHSGDSACAIPPQTLAPSLIQEISCIVQELAIALDTRGLLNAQLAITEDGNIYVLEVNPRASRTVPYVSKTIGIPLAKLATQIMAGFTLGDLGLLSPHSKFPFSLGPESVGKVRVSVKAPVFPFVKFSEVDTILGPEMKSTGEVMGFGRSFGEAFAKASLAAGQKLPLAGTVFISVKDDDKPKITTISKKIQKLGFKIIATRGTTQFLNAQGIEAEMVFKVAEGRPHVVDMLVNREIDLVINTTVGAQAISDSFSIRRTTLVKGIPYFTTIRGAWAAADAIEVLQKESIQISPPLQDRHTI